MIRNTPCTHSQARSELHLGTRLLQMRRGTSNATQRLERCGSSGSAPGLSLQVVDLHQALLGRTSKAASRGAAAMQAYSAYIIGPDGHITKRIELRRRR
jgi:hypothetical protein